MTGYLKYILELLQGIKIGKQNRFDYSHLK